MGYVRKPTNYFYSFENIMNHAFVSDELYIRKFEVSHMLSNKLYATFILQFFIQIPERNITLHLEKNKKYH